MAKNKKNVRSLTVPLDASRVEGYEPGRQVKVLAVDTKGNRSSAIARFGKGGRAVAELELAEETRGVRLLIGPADADDEHLEVMRTLQRSVKLVEPVERLPAIEIPTTYWHWWPLWCRSFTVSGQVICPDGSPVPGARVELFDVDAFWWWTSQQKISEVVTDTDGTFSVTFRWCCGLWPWYWWSLRDWRLSQPLLDKIVPALELSPTVQKIPRPSPKPSLDVFEELLGEPLATGARLSPELLADVGKQLAPRLFEPEIATPIWPWYPWYPWRDCTPDLTFRVTQVCEGVERVILEEDYSDARWNIDTDTQVTLVAPEACCLPPIQVHGGDCVVPYEICNVSIANVGGNFGAPSAPEGYANPGAISTGGDRPFAGNVTFEGVFGDLVSGNVYHWEWSDDGGTSWGPLPSGSVKTIRRWYWGPKVGTAEPPAWHAVDFPVKLVDGKEVQDTRDRYESANDPLSWGITRHWGSGRDLLLSFATEGLFADGTHRFRMTVCTEAGGHLHNCTLLPMCSTDEDNAVVVRLDNRVVFGGSSLDGQPCGSGTVHTCTREPATDILAVRIGGQLVDPCDIVTIDGEGPVEIEFYAWDPDGHLAHFTLHATYGDNLSNDLLSTGTLSPSLASGVAPPAAFAVSSYGAARLAGASAPSWEGGTMKLMIADPLAAFPVSCAYQLELRAYKRTIVSCSGSHYGHWNKSEMSFTVQVP